MKKDIIIPAAGESVTEADIVSWYKENGDYVEMDEPLVELETDKASMDLTAEVAGVLSIDVEDGTVVVGQVIGSIDSAAAAPEKTEAAPVKSEPVSEKAPEVAPAATATADHYAAGHPAPAAQKLMTQAGIAPGSVQGTGKDGRVTKQDVVNHQQQAPQQPKQAPKTQAEAPVVGTKPVGERQTRLEPLSRLRKTLMKRLVES